MSGVMWHRGTSKNLFFYYANINFNYLYVITNYNYSLEIWFLKKILKFLKKYFALKYEIKIYYDVGNPKKIMTIKEFSQM